MSRLPASDPGGRFPPWTVEPWHSVYMDARDYQWNEVAIPLWKDIQARAADADVKVCIEMHLHNVVYNPPTMDRLATAIDATHVGAEMDPSHLFWEGIDPVLAVTSLVLVCRLLNSEFMTSQSSSTAGWPVSNCAPQRVARSRRVPDQR
jgi:hypothetical protein